MRPRVFPAAIAFFLLSIPSVARPSSVFGDSVYLRPFREVFHSEHYRPYHCHRNVFTLLQVFEHRLPDLSAIDVLFVFHRRHDRLDVAAMESALKQSSRTPYVQGHTIPVYRLRSATGESTEASNHLRHHVVALVDNYVLDLDYTDAPAAVPLAEYARNMFTPENVDAVKRKALLDQLFFYRISAAKYLNMYRRRSSFLVFDMNELYPGLSFAELVSPEEQARDYCQEGIEHYEAGRYEKAAFFFRLAADRDNTAARYLTGLLYLRGQGVDHNMPKAIAWFERAADGGSSAATIALGWIYATHRDGAYRNGNKALMHATRAIRLAPDNWYALSTLAAAFARNERFEDAASVQQQAISLLRADRDMPSEKRRYYLERAGMRLELYSNRHPYEE